jgi:hypothetical protein
MHRPKTQQGISPKILGSHHQPQLRATADGLAAARSKSPSNAKGRVHFILWDCRSKHKALSDIEYCSVADECPTTGHLCTAVSSHYRKSAQRRRLAYPYCTSTPNPCSRTALLFHPRHYFQMSGGSCPITFTVCIPGTSVLSRPLQHLKVTGLRCSPACFSIPRAAILTCPLQHFQLPYLSSCSTGVRLPLAPVLPGPLQEWQRVSCCSCTCARVPGAPLTPQPLQHP